MTRLTYELVSLSKGMKGTEMTVLTITIISLLLFASLVSKAQTSAAKAPTSSSIKISRSDSTAQKGIC